MATPDEMVIVDGVRYRPEDAPTKKAPEPAAKQAKQPANKSRSVADK